MSGLEASAGRAGRIGAVLAAAGALCLAAPAGAFEYFDGRLQIHGSFEMQIRALSNNFSMSDDLDLAQWYNVLSVETEYDFAPDGWGPFDVLSGFLRLEARYDCVWTSACEMFPAANAYGNGIKHLPGVKVSGRGSGTSGTAFLGDFFSGPFNPRSDVRRYTEARPEPVLDRRFTEDGQPVAFPTIALQVRTNHRRPARIDQLPGFSGLFVVRGMNQTFERGGDDPAYFYFNDQLRCRFGVRNVPGGANGVGFQLLGPLNPRCEIDEIGALRERPNPFNALDVSPLTGVGGAFELPGRPATEIAQGGSGHGSWSKGVFYPSPGLRRWMNNRDLDNPRLNFSQAELAWNHGDSQGWERELKEAYLDMEFFDSRLWLRVGRQSIVWGKTELFRTTDQFNPVDLALASLPSLEESRVSLWSARAVLSLYDIGPAEDVRVEVAANLDRFKPSDIGRCGEPFTAMVACNKTLAMWIHGLTGFALAGEDRPDHPWQDIEALEFGARVEFRMGRFSFQISDFYGYEDLPYVEIIQTFERRVDPFTGRPIRFNHRSGCITGAEAACLPIHSNINADGSSAGEIVDPSFRREVLTNYGSNIQHFTLICSTSIGFNSADSSACGQSVFNSRRNIFGLADPPIARPMAKIIPTVASLLANSLAGNPVAGAILPAGFTGGVPVPLVRLNADPCDAFFSVDCTTPGRTSHDFYDAGGALTLNDVLSDEQEALLGCGPFWGTDCEVDGVDLLNADAGVLMQSFIGFEGNYTEAYRAGGFKHWHLGNGEAQPGTIGFYQNGAALPATRFANGAVVQVPGARSPLLTDGVTPNPAWDINKDGSIGGLVIPASFMASAGQQFASEMAALSFNGQLLLAAFSQRAGGATTAEKNEFDPTNPFAFFDPADPSTIANQGKCSFLQTQYCGSVQSFYDISGAQRNSVRAGSNAGFGRRDFVWHSGAEGVLRYKQRNVLGFSFDFAEDYTKSNWGAEFTWIAGQRFTDNDQFDGYTDSDTLNLTVSVDRPTFINFLNQNRTFFFNSQVFFQYITNYKSSFPGNGPYNILGTFTVQTGYYQDRLLPGVTFVYDRRSNSGAALPSIAYRFTENFSGTIGMNFFWGRFQTADSAIQPLGTLGDELGQMAYRDAVENGLAVVRERDEIYLRLRYTF